MNCETIPIPFQWRGARRFGASSPNVVEILDEADATVRVVEEAELDAAFSVGLGRRPGRRVRALVLDGVVHLPAFFAEEDALRRAAMPVRPMRLADASVRRDLRYGRRSWWLDPFAVRSTEDDFLVRRRASSVRPPAVAAGEADLCDEMRLALAAGLEEAGSRTVSMDGLLWSSRYQIVVEANELDGRIRTRIVDGLAGTLGCGLSARRFCPSLTLGEWTTMDLPQAASVHGRGLVGRLLGTELPEAVDASPFDMMHETVVGGAGDIAIVAFDDPNYDLGLWPALDHFLATGDFRRRDEADPDDIKALVALASGPKECAGWEEMAEAVRRQARRILRRVGGIAGACRPSA